MRNGLIEDIDGNKKWYLNGQRHRADGPAIEFTNGDKYWFLNGLLHRVDGPAVEPSNGDKTWYQNGKLHRTDGPALEYISGRGFKAWFINGEQVFCKTNEEFLMIVKLKAFL